MDVFFGIFLHLIGGIAAASFYIPFKKVRKWSWESYWIVSGIFSWIFMPWMVALFTVPDLMLIFNKVSWNDIFWTYFMGVLWGIGGLTFGLTMRYLGVSLGMAVALGFCSVFGTILPPIYEGTFISYLNETSGLTILSGVMVCVLGIAVCGWAGMTKERELPEDKKKETVSEFNFSKGLLVAVFSGVLSACMSFGFAAGKPIASAAIENGVQPLWQNTPVLVVILLGGFTTNFIWCIILNIKNKSWKDYRDVKNTLWLNYIFSAIAGITWYLQFMFYGMGSSKMGKFDFTSWTLHMAFIIVVSNMWGLYLNEWKGSTSRTMRLIVSGIVIVIISTIIIGSGNYIGD